MQLLKTKIHFEIELFFYMTTNLNCYLILYFKFRTIVGTTALVNKTITSESINICQYSIKIDTN